MTEPLEPVVGQLTNNQQAIARAAAEQHQQTEKTLRTLLEAALFAMDHTWALLAQADDYAVVAAKRYLTDEARVLRAAYNLLPKD